MNIPAVVLTALALLLLGWAARQDRLKKAVRVLLALILTAGLIAPATEQGMGAFRAQPQLAAAAAQDPSQPVMVIVQKTSPAADVESQAERLGGAVLQRFSIINGFSAQMTASAALRLAQMPGVRWVSLDAPLKKASTADSAACNGANYYLNTTGASAAWDQGLSGKGIGVAVIDSGLDNQPDFTYLKHRASFYPVSRNPNDIQGHGTHVAGILAGNGRASKGFYRGIAPNVSLIGLKVSDENGASYESYLVSALQWVYDNRERFNIRVVNLSLNSSVEQSYHTSPVDAAVEMVWFSGVVVVVSAGNTDVEYNTINAAPANDPFVITVGASDENCTADPADDSIGAFSQSGVSLDGYAKPDIIAPGRNIISVLAQHSDWGWLHPERVVAKGKYFRLSGTSMAAPMVSGAAALLLQAEPNLTPDQVKYRLTQASGSIPAGDGQSTYPYLNIGKAVTTPTSKSANTGQPVSQMLTSGPEPFAGSVSWNSVSWNSVSWNSVSWNSVSWNSVSWNSVSWNSVYWGD